jgi:hypothetical protein
LMSFHPTVFVWQIDCYTEIDNRFFWWNWCWPIVFSTSDNEYSLLHLPTSCRVLMALIDTDVLSNQVLLISPNLMYTTDGTDTKYLPTSCTLLMALILSTPWSLPTSCTLLVLLALSLPHVQYWKQHWY